MALKRTAEQERKLPELYKDFSFVASGANSFHNEPIDTGLTPEGEMIWRPHDIILWPTAANPSFALDPAGVPKQVSLQLSLTNDIRTAVAEVSDKRTIAKYSWYSQLLTAVGQVAFPEMPLVLDFEGRGIIAAPQVHFQAKTLGFSEALALTGRIYYTTEKMARQDILDVLYG